MFQFSREHAKELKKNSKLFGEKFWVIAKTGEKLFFLIGQEICPSAWKNPFATKRNSSKLKLEGNLKFSFKCFNCSRAKEIVEVSLYFKLKLVNSDFWIKIEIRNTTPISIYSHRLTIYSLKIKFPLVYLKRFFNQEVYV